jgi:integrase
MVKSDMGDIFAFEEYLKNKGLAPYSIHIYINQIKLFLKSNPNIDSVDDYNQFIINKSIKKRGTQIMYSLKHYINMKISDTRIKAAIIDNLIKVAPKEDCVMERKYLTTEQLLNVINSFSEDKHKVISLICMMTGVRIGDVMKLKRVPECITPEIYNDKVVLKLAITGKRKKRNVVYIHDKTAIDMIMKYITNNFGFDDFYFLDRKTFSKVRDLTDNVTLYKVNYTKYRLDLKQAVVANGYIYDDFSTQDFRRCFARRAWEKYKDVNILQNLMIHRDPKTTLRYLRNSGLRNIDYHAEMQQ